MEARGRIAFVAGGGSGLGRVAARRWAEAGGIAAVADVDESGLRETARDRPGIHTRVLDVTRFREVEAAVKEVEAELGPIERVYNCAAIQPTGLLLDVPVEVIQRVMKTNYGGVVNVSLATLPRMLERGRGVLVNFASIASFVPSMHFGAYSATKFASAAFTEVLYHENRGRGVHICCVCPPQVDTPLRAQASSKPRIQETGPRPLRPEAVIEAVERGIARRRFWIFPGWHTRPGVWLRRFAPALLWKIDHDTEGI